MTKPKQTIDVHSRHSELIGVKGLLETVMRRFNHLGFLLLLSPVVLLYILCLGVALWPGALLIGSLYTLTAAWWWPWQALVLCFGMASGYLLYGLTLILVVPLCNLPLLWLVKPWRGNWYSLKVIPWYIHNALTQLVRYTFLNICTPTPLTLWFYRLMGMKIGKGVLINTACISDPCLIELGDHVTVGGSVTLFAHYGQKGYLIIAPTRIGNRVNLGLKASVMGNVEIGDGVDVPPHTVLLPGTRLSK